MRPALWLDGVERWAELTEGHLAPEDSDDDSLALPFPVQQWTLSGEAYQNTRTGALWRFAWDRSGDTVPYVFAPNGNATPTADAPHYVGELQIGPRPALGGAAGDRAFIFEFAWLVVGEPEELTAETVLNGFGVSPYGLSAFGSA
ncbi:hypothetical protein [Microbacterium dextranolyticum]|nr:hypothetical protein [Microbacterium dextranolyticum]MBM7462912.1 hypothetical protein [Microbacterium dextranolyticum]